MDGNEIVENFSHLEISHFRPHHPGVQLGYIKQVGQQLIQAGNTAGQIADQLGIGRCQLVLQHANVQSQGKKRLAQIMASGRQKTGFGMVGMLRLGLGQLLLIDRPLQFGNILMRHHRAATRRWQCTHIHPEPALPIRQMTAIIERHRTAVAQQHLLDCPPNTAIHHLARLPTG